MSWVELFVVLVSGYFLVGNVFYLVILVCSLLNKNKMHMESQFNFKQRLQDLGDAPAISILVPAYNEELTISSAIDSLRDLNYPNFEIIISNDGSTDRTFEVLDEKFSLEPIEITLSGNLPTEKVKAVYRSRNEPNLIVIDKKNGGKADALNAALNHSTYPVLFCVDSDSLIDADGLLSLAYPFFEDPESTAAVGGCLKVLNLDLDQKGRPFLSRILGIIQANEYLRGFCYGRIGWNYLRSDMIISGAVGLFNRDLVHWVGGYRSNLIGEDMELLLNIHHGCRKWHKPYRVVFLADPICKTEVPTDLRTLKNQRIRWHQGLAESLWEHRKMLFAPWSGMIGWAGMPYFIFYELLSPFFEILGLGIIAFGIANGDLTFNLICFFFAVTVIFGLFLSVMAFIIDQMTYRHYATLKTASLVLAGAILEQIFYRYVISYWKMIGIVRELRGKRQWGKMRRIGF